MAIDINNYDGSRKATVTDGTLDSADASIKFVGRGYKGWGKPVQENLLWILQNFAGIEPPSNPTTGQIWYDTNADANILKVYNGSAWVSGGGVISQSAQPAAGANKGALWYDDQNLQLHAWNGTRWDLVGPLGSATGSDPRNPTLPTNTAIEAIQLKSQTGSYIGVWRFTIAGQSFAIFSKDPEFSPSPALPGFASIKPGINFDSRISNLGITNSKINEHKLPIADNAYNLGSPANRLANIFAYGTTLSNLQVHGTATLNNNNSSTRPPLVLAEQSSLVSTPVAGAIEYRTGNFVFTNRVNGVLTQQSPLFETDLSTSNRLYVRTQGSDSADGTTPAKSLKTIKKALELAASGSYDAGATIFVEGGVYYEQNPLFVPPNTSVVGDNLRRTVIKPVHDKLDIFHVSAGTYFYGMTFKEHRNPAFCFSFPCSTARAIVDLDSSSPTYGEVTGIAPLHSMSGYNGSDPTSAVVFIEPSGTGTQAQARAILADNAIHDVKVTNPGTTPYSQIPGAVTAAIVGGTPIIPAILSVRLNRAGYVAAVDIVDPGEGYNFAQGATITVAISDSTGSGAGATAEATMADGVIRAYVVTNPGSGYTRAPHVSIRAPADKRPFVTSSPYVQNCSSLTGPFDINGKLIPPTIPLPWDNTILATYGYSPLDENGAGGGIRIDGELCQENTVIRSFVADSFTQINQGGTGHLIINRGYAQFVSCFTTFSSIGYWARSGGFANISNSVIDFGNIGLKAEGYYPVPYLTGTLSRAYWSTVGSVTLSSSGSGYIPNSSFQVLFVGGYDPSGSAAQGTAFTNVLGEIDRVDITNPGSKYYEQPTIDFNTHGGNASATGVVNLIKNNPVNIHIEPGAWDEKNKPQNGTAMLVNGKFYTVTSAVKNGATNWDVVTVPALTAGASGATASFVIISNLSTGGLALEYVGAGVTYNALPTYGGIPDETKQVADGSTDPTLSPGAVYYVTIDNRGNFKIGQFFAVNFADGTVSINSDNFNLTGLSGIGPFKRNGSVVGVRADEISNDALLTHPGADTEDDNTIPTQYAVRQYMRQISTDVIPNTSNVRNLGGPTKTWRAGYFDGITIGPGGSIATTTMGIKDMNATGNVVVAGNLTVSGTQTTIDSASYAISDPMIDIGTMAGNAPLPTDDGRDRGLVLHYFNTIAARGEQQGDNHAFLGRSDEPTYGKAGKLIYVTNVSPGGTTAPNSVPIPGTTGATTVWGNVEIGSMTVHGDLNVTGDITAFYTSDRRLKESLTKIPDALDKVSAINGYTFSWNADAVAMGKDASQREAGVVAQEIESILPEVVQTKEDGFKAVRYEQLIPLLIEAIKDLRREVNDLKSK